MSYFAGTTSKFSQGGVDVNQLVGVGAAIESLNEAANLQAEHMIQTSALNAYQKQQNDIFNFKLQAELGGIQNEANQNSQTLDGIGNVVSGLGGLFNSGGFGLDKVGSQGNPFGKVPVDSSIYGIPGGAAVGGGRVPLNG
jgi:hypothetical protein